MDRLIRFRCKCGKKLKATPEIIGKKVKCTRCPRVHRVPKSDRLESKSSAESKPPKAAHVIAEQENPVALADRPSLLSQGRIRADNPEVPLQKRSTVNKGATAKITSSIAKPPVVIENGAAEPSLVPGNSDGSDSRFKLDPLKAPAPSDELIRASSSSHDFDFDLDAINIETELTEPIAEVKSPAKSKRTKKTIVKKSKPGRSSLAMFSDFRVPLIAGSAIAGILLLTIAGYFVFFSGNGYPYEFNQRPEVQDYIATMQKFRKSKHTYSFVSEAYIKAKSPADAEIDQIIAFTSEIEPLDNQDQTLDTALEFFKSFQPEKARDTLISATQNLSDKIPELEAKAKDYSTKLR